MVIIGFYVQNDKHGLLKKCRNVKKIVSFNLESIKKGKLFQDKLLLWDFEHQLSASKLVSCQNKKS